MYCLQTFSLFFRLGIWDYYLVSVINKWPSISAENFSVGAVLVINGLKGYSTPK